MSVVSRTNVGLRIALFDALDQLRAGTIDHKHANAVARIAAATIESARYDMERKGSGNESLVE